MAPQRADRPTGRVERQVHEPRVGVGAVHGEELGRDRAPAIGGRRVLGPPGAGRPAPADSLARQGVDALGAGTLSGPVPPHELGLVVRLAGRLDEPVLGVVQIERRIARDRVVLIGHRRVDGVQQVVALANVGGEVHHGVGGRQVEAVQVEGVAGGCVLQACSRRTRLLHVEREEGAAARVAAQHDAVVPLPQRGDARGHVEEHDLVQQRRVVVQPAGVEAEDRVPGLDQPGHGVVVREVRSRVHEQHCGGLAAECVQPSTCDRPVGRLQDEWLAGRPRRRRAIPLRDRVRVVVPPHACRARHA